MAVIPIGKKAQVFSLIAVLMSALFIMIFSGANHLAFDRNVNTKRTAIESTDQFVKDLEEFSEEGAKETARKNLYALITYHNRTNNFTDFMKSFKDCFLTGAFKQEYPSSMRINCSGGSENYSYHSTMEQLFDLARNITDANITHKNINVTITQSSPYNFKITTTSEVIIIKDKGGVGEYGWTRHLDTTTYLDITNMPDPMSRGTTYERSIVPHEGMDRLRARASNIKGNLSLLAEYINNEYFIIDQTAPTIVQMLEGKVRHENDDYEWGNNSYGITSYLNDSHYQSNKTVLVEYRYETRVFDECAQLRRIDHENISDDLIFERDYLVSILNISDSQLLEVCDCCDDEGCVNTCG
ncbi:MAG: hypothetical protein ACQESE_02920 [Nanobdellota archaeon]